MLKDKIKNRKSGILLYGMTPPKAKHTKEELKEIAACQIQRIKDLQIDGLVLYDIQDESDRTDIKRPFPFIKTLDSCDYAKNYLDDALPFPVIVYRAVGKYNRAEFKQWLKDRVGREFFSVFVGAASKKTETTMDIKEAYRLKKEIDDELILGGIVIPERHTAKKDEHLRVFSKIENGCEYFISQAVYNLEAAKRFLDDYVMHAKKNDKELVPVVFTFTPCGSIKTLEFMKWLGVHIAPSLEERLKNAEDILKESVKTSIANFSALYEYGKKKDVPIGANVESIAIRKVEIDASIYLLDEIKKILNNGHKY
ncbi:MAG: methylenetetrahydrofolate reductase [Sulfurospirillum sp.]